MADRITLPVVEGSISLPLLRRTLDERGIEALVVSHGRNLYLMTRRRLEQASGNEDEAGPVAARIGRRLRGSYRSHLRLHRLAAARTWRRPPGLSDDLLLAAVNPRRVVRGGTGFDESPVIADAILSTRSEMIARSLRAPVALVICAGRRRHVWDAASGYKTCPSDGSLLRSLDI